MALRGALHHRKTKRLARLLGIDPAAAMGYLEALWHLTDDQQSDGGVGRLCDADIEEELTWSGAPGALVAALIEAKLLDPMEGPGRLYVHGWHERCTRTVKLKLFRNNVKFFANGEPAPDMSRKKRDSVEEDVGEDQDIVGEEAPGVAVSRHGPSASVRVGAPHPDPHPHPDPEDIKPLGGVGSNALDREGRDAVGATERETLRVQTTEQESLREQPPQEEVRRGLTKSRGSGWQRGEEPSFANATAGRPDCGAGGDRPAATACDALGEASIRKAGKGGWSSAGLGAEDEKKAYRAQWERLRQCMGTVAGMRAFFEELEEPESARVIARWVADYPLVDVPGEIIKARDWLAARVGPGDEPMEGFSLFERGAGPNGLAVNYRPWAYFMAWLKNQDRDERDPGGRALQRGVGAVMGSSSSRGGGESGALPSGAVPIKRCTKACAVLRRVFDEEFLEQWVWPCFVIERGQLVTVFAENCAAKIKLHENYEARFKEAFGNRDVAFCSNAEVVSVVPGVAGKAGALKGVASACR